ncbi:toprim domain-containing protein [Desulfoluna spongiiphila]|uniref:toprim domain-containing protein n=1 Tax=Desulfoluna spongiiphila TaxID=419481 RepID=UPI0012554BD0|nr:toprim domain-containing protein [Desulfoluna spongiiphila]VVS92205.1 toprim-like [Desulfoluna spongiiphila]
MYDGHTPNNRAQEIVSALRQDSRFQFKEQGNYLRYGICPNCGHKELYVSKSMPFRIECGRKEKCRMSWTAKELLPHLFENYEKRFPPTRENPNATADAYLIEERGFSRSRIQGWYRQCQWKDGNSWITAVRFPLSPDGAIAWERLIRKGQDGRKANFIGAYKGLAWVPPGQVLNQGERCFITEGIFDSLAFHHAGYKTAAAMSSGNFPDKLIKGTHGRGVVWVLALDGDKAGTTAIRKHAKRLKEMGQHVAVCLPPDGNQDWNDLWKAGKLNQELIDEGLYQGRLFMAKKAMEKAWLLHMKKNSKTFMMDHGCAMHIVKVEAAYSAELQESGLPPDSEDALDLFKGFTTITRVSNVSVDRLYLEKDMIMGEQWYVFGVSYQAGYPKDRISLDGGQIATKDGFHKALLSTTRGGTFTGTPTHFSMLNDKWHTQTLPEVKSIPYVGREDKTGAYIFNDHAFMKGVKLEKNDHGYFEIDGQGYRCNMGEISIMTEGDFDPSWLPDFHTAFSWQGLAALAWWTGTLFAQQIREKHEMYPFFELTGEWGAGKSTLLKFLWKTFGRKFEGVDPLKTTPAGRRRTFNQVSCLPIVLIEGDREGTDQMKGKQFDFDELKTMFEGGITGTLGIPKRNNATEMNPFRATLLFSQNAEVVGSKALLSRICYNHLDKSHHKEGTDKLAAWFRSCRLDEVSGYLPLILSREKELLSLFHERYAQLYDRFQTEGVKGVRVVECHACVAAMGHVLARIFPDMNEERVEGLTHYLMCRAKDRDGILKSETPVVSQFWETFRYLNQESALRDGALDHSKESNRIALNLNEFRQACQYSGQELMDIKELKAKLSESKHHQLVSKNIQVRSRVTGKNVRCWVFTCGKREKVNYNGM